MRVRVSEYNERIGSHFGPATLCTGFNVRSRGTVAVFPYPCPSYPDRDSARIAAKEYAEQEWARQQRKDGVQ